MRRMVDSAQPRRGVLQFCVLPLPRDGARSRSELLQPLGAAAVPGERMGRRGAHEWLAIFGVSIGGLVVPIVGWFVAVVLLWTSHAWNTKDKLIGTLLLPGGLAGVFLALTLGAASGMSTT